MAIHSICELLQNYSSCFLPGKELGGVSGEVFSSPASSVTVFEELLRMSWLLRACPALASDEAAEDPVAVVVDADPGL